MALAPGECLPLSPIAATSHELPATPPSSPCGGPIQPLLEGGSEPSIQIGPVAASAAESTASKPEDAAQIGAGGEDLSLQLPHLLGGSTTPLHDGVGLMFLLLGGRGSEPEVGEKGYGAITPCAHGGAQRLDWSTALVIAVVGAAPEMATLLPLAACGWGPPSGDQASKWVQFQPPSAPPLHALSSATAFRYRPPRGRLRWSWSQLIPGGRTYAPLSFRWSPWDPSGYRRASSAC